MTRILRRMLPRRARNRWAIMGIAVALAAVAVLVLVGGLVLARSGKPLPGTFVADTDVGGLGADDLRVAIEKVVTARQATKIPVTAAGRKFSFTPGADGFGGDLNATVDAALAAGRGGFLGLGGQVSASFGGQRQIELQGAPIDQAIAVFVRKLAADLDQSRSPGEVRVDPDSLDVEPTPPQDGLQVQVDEAIAALDAVVGDPDPPVVELPTTVDPAPTDQAAVDDAATRAQQAVADSLLLTTNGGQTTLSPSQIAMVLRTQERDGRLVLTADADRLAELLSDDLGQLEAPPRDATFEVVSGRRTFDDQGAVTWTPTPAEVEVVPSRSGQVYDPQSAAEQVGKLLDAGTREGPLGLKTVPASLTTDDVGGNNVSLIGTFTTYHKCCQNRVTNIHRIADIIRGKVLRPGETFSINDYVGRRTREKGFVADGAIYQGEIRDEVGGGISQFATTMFNAAFFAGIPIPAHRAHSLYISRYPLGREATVNYDSIDLAITNDTDAAMFIDTSYTDTSITVSLFGNNGGRQVRAVMGEPHNFRDFPTRTRQNSSLAPGAQRLVQSGKDGYQVQVQRVITGGGRDATETMVATYRPKPKVVEVGPG